MQALSPAEIQKHVAAYFSHLVARTDLASMDGLTGTLAEVDPCLWAAQEGATQLKNALVEGRIDDLTMQDFSRFLTDRGANVAALCDLRELTARGAMAARIEHARYLLHRYDRPDVPFSSANAAFSVLHIESASKDAAHEPLYGLTVACALDAYVAERKTTWTAKTLGDYLRVFGWLREHLGEEAALSRVTKQDAVSFRAAILSMEAGSAEPSLKGRQTADVSKRISLRTANKYVRLVKTFFEWACGDAALLSSSPFAKISVKYAKGKSGAAKAATPEGLENFLVSPLFQGHSGTKLHLKGGAVTRGEHYWLFLLQLFVGARIGEVCQLRVSDVKSLKGTPAICFRLTDDVGAVVPGKSLKTAAAARDVPLPKVLLELGFLQFVDSCAVAAQDPLLFPAFAPRTVQQTWSDRATKFASRYLERIGQKQKAKATHWLRHAWTDAMKDGGVEDTIIAQLEGHAEAGMKAVYGKGNNWTAKTAAIDKADFGFDARAVLLRSKANWVR